MAAQPTAIVTQITDVVVDPNNATRVLLTIEYRLLFVPDAASLPLVEQATLDLADTFTKQDAKSAAQTAVIDSVAAKGASISTNRIFGVDDFV
jgi:hypothetical protein